MSRPSAGGYLGTFLGLPMHQRWEDLALWECVLQEAGPLRMIVELGTGTGAFSTFLALQCLARGLGFMTVDRSEALPDNRVGKAIDLCLHRVVGDIWGGGGVQVEDLLSREAAHPLLLFCDDGDKPREMRTFGPLLRIGDVLAVHDWGTEVRREHVEAVRPLLPGRRLVEMATGEMTRFWLVQAEEG